MPEFDEWLDTQDEDVRAKLEEHLASLKAEFEAERSAKNDLESQLAALQSDIAEQHQREAFYETAAGAGVTNLELAYMAAKATGQLEAEPAQALAMLKQRHPELFGIPGRTRAGAGAGSAPPAPTDMNRWIRRASGRG